MRRYKGTFDIFFGNERRMRREVMEEEQFNKESKQGWRFAADAARIDDENAGSKDRKHTSGGVFVAIDSNLGAVDRQRRRSGHFYSMKMKGKSPKHGSISEEVCATLPYISGIRKDGRRETNALTEAAVKQARTTRHPWLVACDGNMNPEDFKKSLRAQKQAHVH